MFFFFFFFFSEGNSQLNLKLNLTDFDHSGICFIQFIGTELKIDR